jgi:amino acid adenylation domain-containing protein
MNDTDEKQYEGIAIIGMSGRFPGAESVEAFWANLLAGKDTVSFFSDTELAESGLDPAELRRHGQYVPARGVLADADCFDAAFFGVHPKEAEVMDPQHRLFLETCWAAMENAGYVPGRAHGSVGVFGGATYNTYYLHAIHPRPDVIDMIGPELVMFGNEKDYLTTRVAYKLDLKGPAVNVSTACSTSLVAVAQACQSLLMYQCDLALAGGVSVGVPQKRGYYFQEGYIGSPDGHTRTFDVQAAGTTFGNGVGIVVLKRLEDAVRDGDRIYAVVKGAALNNDGSQRVSFGAPGVEGQSEVIAMAHALAGVEPGTIRYVEAHGTATPLGDPIELAGLTKAFRLGTEAKQFCAIGSVKTNVGHLDAAAGVTGLIKTALSLDHKVIPASLHFTQPNPKLDIENSPFYVNSQLSAWNIEAGMPRRAGISSFGSGGTNAHLVLEEAPELAPSGPSRPWQLLTLSAKTPEALDRMTSNLSAHLAGIGQQSDAVESARNLADSAFTLHTGRAEFAHRRIAVCQNPAEGAAVLAARDSKRVFSQRPELREPPVVFMFPGQGAQYPGMGAELYRSEQVFRAEVDHCVEFLRPLIGLDLRTLMFPPQGAEKDAAERLTQTQFTQPALFIIEYALAKLWMSWGVKPAAMIGHSVGEYVAGCLAGVFTLEDALTLVARRAAIVQEQPGGSMLGVRLGEQEVRPFLNGTLAIAAINSPNLCVVAGPRDAVRALEGQLASRSVVAKHLHTSHAFHSKMMEPVIQPFTEFLRQFKLAEPSIPYVSNVTGEWITAEQATSPEYWAGHVRQTVRFADGIGELLKDPRRVFLEVGPGHTLSTLARQHPLKSNEQVILASLPLAGVEELRGTLETAGRLWMAGVAIDWQEFYSREHRHRVPLPAYPFERKRFWPESAPMPERPAPQVTRDAAEAPLPAASPHAAPPQALPVVEAKPSVPRKERLVEAARTLLHELSGYDLSDVEPSLNLLELGLDSLLLTRGAQLFQRKFGVPITFRQLMEELSSLAAIADYLDSALPPEAFVDQPVVPVAQPATAAAPAAGVVAGSVLEQLLQQQQQLTNQLLQMLGQQVPAPVAPARGALVPIIAAPPSPKLSPPAAPDGKSHGPFKPIDRAASLALSPVQSQFLDALIVRYVARTAGSKKLAAENRSILADPRSVGGFKQLWKEMVYPFYTTRSEGSKVWDVDGNEYVDFVMGFGASLFGHRPPFVVDALHKQVDAGFEIGPIQPLAGEVAALMCEFTGMQRVGFTNTGSEAVLAATRVARTVTGRDKIAVFAGAYHGIFDEVLFRPLTINGETRTAPIAPGIPDSALSEVIVLDYGNPQSLDILRARGSEIAAVLVEPVQSRRLDLQPKEFMHDLRKVTQETGSALIFDEVVTGFRVAPGGAQAYFGVRADLATYGKVIGGGLSIGVVAGDPRFMDALDGGNWQYGDTSFPEVGVTFFAGTFVRHPLALAAAKAVLTHLKQSGPELQRTLTRRTEQLAHDLRAIIAEFKAPYAVTQFSSLIQLSYPAEQKFAGLLFYLLRQRGIHIWDNRAFVMTTAHTDQDLSHLSTALRESLAEMQSVGFLPEATYSTPVAGPGEAALTPPAGDATGTFPLTEAQKEIWFAAQMGGDAAVAYNESLKLEFRGPFEIEVFRAAVRHIFARHPILSAKMSADGMMQTVEPGALLEVPWSDLSSDDQAGRERALAEALEKEVSEPFDLTSGPLLRVRVMKLADAHYVVLWTAHHIVCDGWSGGLIISELAAIYRALLQQTSATLDAPIPFRSYALAKQAGSPGLAEALEYWRGQFSSSPSPLDLPTDRPRPLIRTARADTLKRTLDASIHQSLKRTAGKQRTTLVVLLMTGLKTLLYRLTGQTDLVVGLGAAGQAVTGQTCLVGHCVNLLPIRTQLRADASFQENLAAVKTSILNAYDHHQSSIGSILQQLKVPRSTNRPPLVEVIFNLDPDAGSVEFPGLEFKVDRTPKRALHFDLFLNVVEGPRGIVLECDYNTDLFDAVTIERWLRHYQTLLEGIAADPTATIAKLPLLTETERREIAIDWNMTGVEFPKELTLHEWFERQVEKAPDVAAVTFEGRHLTYRELNGRANQLANHLRRQGVSAETLVAVCAERSIEMVVALLGIVKAGGAYVPLDPEYPAERLALLLEDLGHPLVLTQEKFASRLPQGERRVALDRDWSEISAESGENPAVVTGPESAAYVIYTSGSTGKPKGVVNIHEGIVNRLLWMQDAYRIGPGDRVLQKTPYTFDVSVWEFFWPLITGACLVMAEPGGHRDPSYLTKIISDEQITTLHFVPSMLDAFLDEPGLEQLSSVCRVICSGEALPYPTQMRFFARMPQSELHNLYGPTEASVDVTYWKCAKDSPYTFVPIGKPIANTQIYVLDGNLNPVPVGVPGELYIGGVGVARGYLNRPELTAERFVADPFAEKTGARLYKTGDLVRFLADGNIEYLGRGDDQVKIRGLRIELGEIEAAIRENPAVKQVVVVAREDGSSGKRLVAYLISEEVAADALFLRIREALKRKLPDYMVPSAFVMLEKIPLSANGKIDRKALPAPDMGESTQMRDYVAPRNQTQSQLAGLWAEVLKLERVGIDDNFFESGGHSLTATQLISRIRGLLGVDVPLQSLFRAPTVAGYAEYIEAIRWTAVAPPASSHATEPDRLEIEL